MGQRDFGTKTIATGVAIGAAALLLVQVLTAGPSSAPVAVDTVAVEEQPPAGRQGPPRQGGPRGPLGPEPLALDDRTGFTPIFNGTSLEGWEGDTAYWRAEGGSLVGETTKDNPLTANTFIIYRGDEPGDFELKLEYRMNAGNTGIQYRSARLPEAGPYVLQGYQADIDFENRWTGQLYEERGRGFLALRGQMASMPASGGKGRLVGQLKTADEIKAAVKVNDWNTFHVIARGNVLTHIVNGHVSAVFVDDDASKRSMKGLIGFQLHTGEPMKVEFRNVALRKIG